jgi:hypothetical protein
MPTPTESVAGRCAEVVPRGKKIVVLRKTDEVLRGFWLSVPVLQGVQAFFNRPKAIIERKVF